MGRGLARRVLASVLVPVMLAVGTVSAKSKDMIKMVSTEVSYTQNNNIVKFRPFVYTIPDTHRMDLMLGRKFGDSTIYGYYKSDNKGRAWMGARVDKRINLADKLSANLQLRYFIGLNESSANHFYFIPSVDYKIDDRFKIGVMGYAKKTESKDPFFYIGPSFGVKLSDRVNTSVSYSKDVLGNSEDLLFLSLRIKFK